MVARTRLIVTLYVNCLSSYVIVWQPDEGSTLERNLVARILLKVVCV